MKKKRNLILILVLIVMVSLVIYFLPRNSGKTVGFETTVAREDTLETTVMATGYVQPVDQVEVGTQVSGVIEKIFVDYNSQVKKGQLLAELDKSTLVERLNQSRASVTSAQSNLTYAQQNYDRVKYLYDAGAATQVDYESAVNQLTQAQTSLANSNADYNQASVNLSYAEIYSPIDGVVLERAVEEGQTVAASFSTPTLFTIANDLTKMQVEADVDEADIGRVRLGQPVTFTVDAYADDIFTGTVEQIRLQPTVTNNVVTYTVIVEAPNPEEKLYPGMTASITIVTDQQQGTVVPVEALNFTMTEEIAARSEEEVVPLTEPVRGDSHQRSVWVKQGDRLVQKPLTIGLNDGVNAVVRSGLATGEEVVLSVVVDRKLANQAASNPLMPSPRRR